MSESHLPTGPFAERFIELMQPDPPAPEPQPETKQDRLRREIAEINLAKDKAMREASEWASRQWWAQPQEEQK